MTEYVFNVNAFKGVIIDELLPFRKRPSKVIYNDPATIVFWNDGTKTIVKCHPDDVYDPEKGFLLCCAKKLMGNKGCYNDEMRKHACPSKPDDRSKIAKKVADALWREFKEAE